VALLVMVFLENNSVNLLVAGLVLDCLCYKLMIHFNRLLANDLLNSVEGLDSLLFSAT
jgi:hypothetical protein